MANEAGIAKATLSSCGNSRFFLSPQLDKNIIANNSKNFISTLL
jgi:hypothetical protein